jgi:hypothetical protein
MTFRARYFLFGGIAIVAAVSVIGWYFFGGRRDVLKSDGGPVVTVMDFGRSFPLDPLPPGWKHQKFWTRSPMTMSFAVKDGVPGMRFETHARATRQLRALMLQSGSCPPSGENTMRNHNYLLVGVPRTAHIRDPLSRHPPRAFSSLKERSACRP